VHAVNTADHVFLRYETLINQILDQSTNWYSIISIIWHIPILGRNKDFIPVYPEFIATYISELAILL